MSDPWDAGMLPGLKLPVRAAIETARAHGIAVDRCGILQNASTLVLRLSEDLVARIVVDVDGPRQGSEWFQREIAVAEHLARSGAPVIPLHPALPPGPYEHLGYTLNFWQFVTRIDDEPAPARIGETLQACHSALRSLVVQPALPQLGILTESLTLMARLEEQSLFTPEIVNLLRETLEHSIEALREFPAQPVHGDAHLGNLLNTTSGLLWTDWEDAFAGPVEWDLASAIWNAQVLDGDWRWVDAVLAGYVKAGGNYDARALYHCMTGRAAVMTAWYPILYPQLTDERRARLKARLVWLEERAACR